MVVTVMATVLLCLLRVCASSESGSEQYRSELVAGVKQYDVPSVGRSIGSTCCAEDRPLEHQQEGRGSVVARDDPATIRHALVDTPSRTCHTRVWENGSSLLPTTPYKNHAQHGVGNTVAMRLVQLLACFLLLRGKMTFIFRPLAA